MTGGRATHITTGATAVVSAAPTTLHRVVVGTELGSGTLKLYDCAASADVGAGTLVSSIKLDTRGYFEFGLYFAVGLTYVLSGTADITLVTG